MFHVEHSDFHVPIPGVEKRFICYQTKRMKNESARGINGDRSFQTRVYYQASKKRYPYSALKENNTVTLPPVTLSIPPSFIVLA
jgi:hypothetical protein